jgi:hypothetical protein
MEGGKDDLKILGEGVGLVCTKGFGEGEGVVWLKVLRKRRIRIDQGLVEGEGTID